MPGYNTCPVCGDFKNAQSDHSKCSKFAQENLQYQRRKRKKPAKKLNSKQIENLATHIEKHLKCQEL